MKLETHWFWQYNGGLQSPKYVYFYFQGGGHGSAILRYGRMNQLETAALTVANLFVADDFGYRNAIVIYFLGCTHLFFTEAATDFRNYFDENPGTGERFRTPVEKE